MDPINLKIEKEAEQTIEEQAEVIKRDANFSQIRLGKFASQCYRERNMSDPAIAELIDNTYGRSSVNNARRVWETFGDGVYRQGLVFAHFRLALLLDDAEEWIELAAENGWSAARMVEEYEASTGASVEDDFSDEEPSDDDEALEDDIQESPEDAADAPNSKEEEQEDQTLEARSLLKVEKAIKTIRKYIGNLPGYSGEVDDEITRIGEVARSAAEHESAVQDILSGDVSF